MVLTCLGLIITSPNISIANDRISIELIEHQEIPEFSDLSQWETILSLPGRDNEFLIAQSSGNISILSQDSLKPLLTAEQFSNNEAFIRLSTAALHPNFSLRDQQGFGLLYIAHIEVKDNAQKPLATRRLNSSALTASHQYDLVLSEWRLNELDHDRIDLSSHRELMRIGTEHLESEISHLVFNPYIKHWDEDFGELYIGISGPEALADESHLKKGLLSGTILRIYPHAFGTKRYTIPAKNKNINAKSTSDIYSDELDNSVFSYRETIHSGIGNIIEIFWTKQNTLSPFVEHTHAGKQKISELVVGQNWRTTKAAKQYFEQENSGLTTKAIVYTGKDIPEFRNQLVELQHIDSQWQLSHKNFSNTKVQNNGANSAISAELPINEDLSNNIVLTENQDNDLIVLDISAKSAFKVVATAAPSKAESGQTKSYTPLENENEHQYDAEEAIDHGGSANESSSWIIIVLILVLFGSCGSLYYLWLKYFPKEKGKYPQLKSQYARYEFSEDETHISLFNRHRNKPEKQIKVTDIATSEIQLNKESISICNQEKSFQEEAESSARQAFEKESRLKMVDEKKRQIRLVLIDTEGHQFAICPYYRKGNQRMTRTKYKVVIERIIEWQWFISSILHDHERPEKPSVSIETTHPRSLTKKKPSHPADTDIEQEIERKNKDSRSQPKVNGEGLIDAKDEKQLVDVSDNALSSEHSPAESKIVANTSVDANSEQPNVSKTSANKADSLEADAKIIEAIDKLVSLKQRGHITEQEFELAKAKLLQDLVSN